MIHKIGIGTAQFGLDYGISNTKGQTSLDDVHAILKDMHSRGMKCIDTAQGYGESEAVLGACIKEHHDFEIITKVPAFTDEPKFFKSLQNSLKNLNQSGLYGLLVHNADDLLGQNGAELFKAMQDIKTSGQIQKIGASVYGSAQIDALLERYELDLIQLPFNILDQRLSISGHLDKLKSRDIEIHARSIFLQGALLMDSSVWPEFLGPLKPYIIKLEEFCQDNQCTKLSLCLAFALQHSQIDRLIIGVNTYQHFQEILEEIEKMPHMPNDVFEQFACNESALLNPAHWTQS